MSIATTTVPSTSESSSRHHRHAAPGPSRRRRRVRRTPFLVKVLGRRLAAPCLRIQKLWRNHRRSLRYSRSMQKIYGS